MEPSAFVATVTLYLLAWVVSIMLFLFARTVGIQVLRILAIIHLVTITGYCVVWFRNDADGLSFEPWFLAVWVSGVVMSSLIWRKQTHWLFRVYSLLFIVSLVAFVVFPSRLIGFIGTGNPLAINPARIHLSDNYYLVEHSDMNKKETPGNKHMRLIREMGVFHLTLVRNIQIPEAYDSVSMNQNMTKDSIFVRVYHKGQVEVFSLSLEKKKNSIIQQRN
jgi:hypothetical protein